MPMKEVRSSVSKSVIELTPRRALTLLARWYLVRGYARWQNPDRVAPGGRDYHKGDEIRLMAPTLVDVRAVRMLLQAAGFKAGRPFQKGAQQCVPLYGRTAVARFMKAVAAEQKVRKKAKTTAERTR